MDFEKIISHRCVIFTPLTNGNRQSFFDRRRQTWSSDVTVIEIINYFSFRRVRVFSRNSYAVPVFSEGILAVGQTCSGRPAFTDRRHSLCGTPLVPPTPVVAADNKECARASRSRLPWRRDRKHHGVWRRGIGDTYLSCIEAGEGATDRLAAYNKQFQRPFAIAGRGKTATNYGMFLVQVPDRRQGGA